MSWHGGCLRWMMCCVCIYRDGLEDNHAGAELFGSGPGDCDPDPECLLEQVSG